MLKSTDECLSDGIDLEVLDPRWPELEGAPDRNDSVRRSPTRALGVTALVIASLLAAVAGTHWVDDRSVDRPTPAAAPAWMSSCQAAITATAELHRLQGVQLEHAMQATWAAVAGARVRPESIDTSATDRQQRAADDATARCVSSETPSS
jgi:hypothetical protein